MRISARLQLLTCLIVYASSAHAIKVKFGTNDGPIVPPTPEPTLAPQPYRDPAPVWEERTNDTPDPNAKWRPFFMPQPRYTNVVFNAPALKPLPLNNAQRFANSYLPTNKPTAAVNQANQSIQGSSAILSSQTIPGIGLRYFFPVFRTEAPKAAKQEDAKSNNIDADLGTAKESASDFQWVYEKDATRRMIRNSQEASAGVPRMPVYQFPVYVQPRQH